LGELIICGFDLTKPNPHTDWNSKKATAAIQFLPTSPVMNNCKVLVLCDECFPNVDSWYRLEMMESFQSIQNFELGLNSSKQEVQLEFDFCLTSPDTPNVKQLPLFNVSCPKSIFFPTHAEKT
jgi:hypothetical protein